MKVNRSYLIDYSRGTQRLVTATIFVIITLTFTFSPSCAFPASHPRRQSMTFVDRLIRASPFRALPKVGVQLPYKFYYPGPHAPVPRPAAGDMNYFKPPLLPQASRPQIYYSAPPLAMITPPLQPQHHSYHQQLYARTPKYFGGRFAYPVPIFNHHYQQQQHPSSPGFSSYRQARLLAHSQNAALALETVNPTRFPKAYNVDLAPLLHNFVNSSGVKITTPTIGSPMDSTYNQESHATGNSNLVRVLIIRPSDLEKMRNSSGKLDITPQDFMKGYTIKYLAADGKQMVITTQSLVQPQESEGTKTNEQNVTCIEPFCDPFLRQLIPELMTASSSPSDNNDEPIVIIKNSNATRSELSNVGNQHARKKIQGGYFDVVNSIEVLDEQDEILDAEQSQLQPKVHFPTKNLSAKINYNVTSSRKYYYNPPKLR